MDFSRPAQPDLNSLFGGTLQHVPGVGYVNGMNGPAGAPGNPVGALGDEAAVMMISGLGDEGRAMSATADRAAMSLRYLLTQPVTVGPVTQPLWVWLLGAFGVAGFAGWFFFLKKK